MEDVSNKCRLCLKVLKGRVLGKNMFQSGIAEIIFEIFQLKLDNLNDWPTDACRKCQKQIEDIKIFRNQIQDSQSSLSSLLTKSETINNSLPDNTMLLKVEKEEVEDVEILIAPPEEEPEPESLPAIYFENSEHDDTEVEVTIKDEVCTTEDTPPEAKRKKGRRKMKEENPERAQPSRRNKKTFVLKRHGLRPYSVEQEVQLEEQMRSMGLLTCNLCKLEVDSLRQLHNHFKETHQTYAYIYCCNGKRRCGIAAFEHVEYHLNGTKFQCSICDVILRSRFLLKNHIAMYHAAPEAPEFKCEECDRVFKSRGKRNYHMKKHSKPCKCSYCGKGFDNKNHVRRHIERMHEIADRAVCDICGKWFSSECTLALHLNRHKSQENKKTCPHCGKQVADLTQHVNVVHLGTRRGGIIKIPGQPVIYPNQQQHSIPTQFTVTLPIDDGDPSSTRNIIIQQI